MTSAAFIICSQVPLAWSPFFCFLFPPAQTHHVVSLDSVASLIIITPVASPLPAHPALYHYLGMIL